MTTSEQNSISEYQLAKTLAQTAGCAAPGSKYMILQFQELQGRIPPWTMTTWGGGLIILNRTRCRAGGSSFRFLVGRP